MRESLSQVWSAHGAGLSSLAEQDANCFALAALIGLRAAQHDDQPFGRKLHVRPVEADQLGAAEGAGEADEQPRPVPLADQGRR